MKRFIAFFAALFLSLSFASASLAQTIQEIAIDSKTAITGICSLATQPTDTVEHRSQGYTVKVGCKDGKPIWAIAEGLDSTEPTIYGDINGDGFVERLVGSLDLARLSQAQIDGINRIFTQPISRYLKPNSMANRFRHEIEGLPNVEMVVYDVRSISDTTYSIDLHLVQSEGEWMIIFAKGKTIVGEEAATTAWTVNMNADLAFSVALEFLKKGR